MCVKQCFESKEISKLWNSEKKIISVKNWTQNLPFGYFILFSERFELTPYKDMEAGRPQLMWTLSSAPTWELELKLGQLSNYYYCVLSMMMLIQIGFTCLPSIDPFQVGNWKYEKCYYRMRHLFYYKVQQNRPELRLSCEYLINLLRRRFQNYYTILRVINKTQFKSIVVLNY